MKTPRFIVVEGLDGTGKSTIAKQLAESLDYQYKKTPSDTFQKARSYFDVPEISTLERISFYLADCLKLSMQVQTNEELFLVVDRYFYSTLAYHLEQDPDLTRCFEPLVKNLRKPDLVILLHTDFEISRRRIQERSATASYEDKFLNREAFQRIFNNYLELIDAPKLIIENSGTVEETLERIIQEIRTRL
jgi:dTMP kinase